MGKGVYWRTHRNLPSSREREMDGKKVNGQEIDTATILPVERVRKEERREGGKERRRWIEEHGERLEKEEVQSTSVCRVRPWVSINSIKYKQTRVQKQTFTHKHTQWSPGAASLVVRDR